MLPALLLVRGKLDLSHTNHLSITASLLCLFTPRDSERSRSAIAITVQVVDHTLQSVCCNAIFSGSPLGVLHRSGDLVPAHRACAAQPVDGALSCACARCAGHSEGSQLVLPYTPARRNVPFRRTNYERRAETDHFCVISSSPSSSFCSAAAAAVSVIPG